MNNYRLYDTTDFVMDDDFIQWVYEGKNDVFWNNWIELNPGKQLAVAEARRILQSLQPAAATITENEVDEEVNKLLNSIRPAEQTPVYKINTGKKWWWAEASLVLLAGLAALTITLLNRNSASENSVTSQLLQQDN